MAVVDDASSASRLTDLFCRLAAIPSPTRSERACADVVEAELTALGLSVRGDGAGAIVGGDCDNLYCRIPATAPGQPLLLCAHLDTVPPTDELRPIVVDGVLRNATPAIVGADNKAAVVVLIDVARTVCLEQRLHAGIELLFTVGEEQGLLGSRALDPEMLVARTAFVLDHPGAIGGYVAAAPSRLVVRARMLGRAAHSGISPERGVNAIVALAEAVAAFPAATPEVTVNVATVRGGGALNVVPDRAELGIDVRSIDHDAAVGVVDQIETTLRRAAARAGCTVELEVDNPYVAYRLPQESEALALFRRACGRLGLPVGALETRGGSDANALRTAGLDCLNLAHAVVDFHGPDERVAVADLVLMQELLLEIVAGSCEPR